MKNAHLQLLVHISRLIGLCMLVSSCAGAHLHDPEMAQLARDANEGFLQIRNEIDAEFQKESDNLSSLLANELAEVERLSKNDRDAALAIMATSDVSIDTLWFGEKGWFRIRLDDLGLKAGTAGYAKTLEKLMKSIKKKPHLVKAVAIPLSVLKSNSIAVECSDDGNMIPDSEKIKDVIKKAFDEISKLDQSTMKNSINLCPIPTIRHQKPAWN